MKNILAKRSITANLALLAASLAQGICSAYILTLYFPFKLISVHGLIYAGLLFAVFLVYLTIFAEQKTPHHPKYAYVVSGCFYVVSLLLFSWIIYSVEKPSSAVPLPIAILAAILISNYLTLFLLVLFNRASEKPSTGRLADLVKFIVGGIIFYAIFHLAYLEIKPHLYENRDDGIITLSHVRNLVEYGSIGVNPAGERVEGFSTPAQFLLFLPVYFLTRMDFSTWSVLQTTIATFVVGGVFLLFFGEMWIGVPFTIAAAVLLSFNPSFIEWHASGMENSILHVLFLIALYILSKQLRSASIHPAAVFLVLFAAIARIESIYYILPLVCIFTLFWWMAYRNLKGVFFLGGVLLAWAIIMAGRWLYFGQIFPNTADAQGISVFANFQGFVHAIITGSENDYAGVISHIFLMHGGWIFLVGLAILPFTQRTTVQNFILAACAGMIALSLLSPLVFSASRIDETRTTTQMAIFVVLFFCVTISQVQLKHLSTSVTGAAILLVIGLARIGYQEPYYLGWDYRNFIPVQTNFLKIAQENEITRPTVANADLGIISWQKEFNIIDLAYLGNPVVAKLKNEPEKLGRYIFQLVLPDMIEIHEPLPCIFDTYAPNNELQLLYTPVDPNQVVDYACPSGYFIRKDIIKGSQSAERIFMDNLQKSISVDLIQAEIQKCKQLGDKDGCLYVTRSVYRLLPEVRKMGLFPQVLESFRNSPSVEFDRAILNSANDGHWPEKVIDYINSTIE